MQSTRLLSSVLADVKGIQDDMISVLNSTTWPPTASTHVEAFINALDLRLDQNNLTGDKTIPRDRIDAAMRALRSARKELEAKADMFNNTQGSTSNSIKRKFAFRFPNSTVDFLEGCRTKAKNSLTILDNLLREASQAGVAAERSGEIGSVAQPPAEPSSPAAPEAPPPVTTAGVSNSRNWSWLEVTKAGFKTLDATSGVIPVVGGYIGAVAKAGSTVIEMIETMKDNDETAKQLAERVCRLSEMLDRVSQTSKEPKGDRVVSEINQLQAELDGVKKEVEDLKADGKAAKFMSGGKNAQTLKDFQERVRIALEETQVKATFATSIITAEIYENILFDRLGDGSYGARANLEESATCLDGTRVALLARIDAWIDDMEAKDRIFWITGSAGRGKSTVASTVAMKWKQQTPCALFHFRRGQNTLDTTLICSLAKQLAKGGDKQLFDAIITKVRSNTDIAQQPLGVQFTTLLASPLAECRVKPILIVVDALDECSSSRYAQDFVTLVKRHASSLPPNIKFLLTSRPDYPILPNLRDSNNQVHDLNLEPMEAVLGDIEQYLRHGFAEIRREHGIQEDWPTDNAISQLAKMSEGLFQWAQTILIYVGERAQTTRLAEILDPGEKWQGLDSVYEQVLSKAIGGLRRSAPKRELFFHVLETIIAAERPVTLEVIAFLQHDATALKGKDPTTASGFLRDEILADLNSLLVIPPMTTDPLLLTHTSIRDFLLDHDRCNEQSLAFSVDIQRSHAQLAISCLEWMNRLLKKNMCDIPDVAQPFHEIKSKVLGRIPNGLRYCCESWTFHLTGAGHSSLDPDMSNELATRLVTYSTQKALFWLEVMSALGCLSQAVQMAREANQWLPFFHSPSSSHLLPVLWQDVHRFGSAFAEPITINPLEIYRSALAHCLTNTELWKHFQSMAEVRTVRGPQGAKWSADVWTKRLGSMVWTVAMSPNGKLLASGSNDGLIRLLDTHTGAQIGEPLTGHAKYVWSVCFSPDGKLLASASSDKTVRLWGAHTGAQVGEPLTGHTDSVRSVCFSPDGKLLASASDDKTVRLWEAHTGDQAGKPLTGHTESVQSVCFSPDGKLLASASMDETVRLWDPHTGTQAGEPLVGHTDSVCSVSFSSNGKLLASASKDKTVRIWDAQTGAQVREPLTGHRGTVWSVCFSPDGKLLVSASDDKTVRLWDARKGSQVGEPLTGHTNLVHSVCFSPDSKLLASASSDATVRLWDADTWDPHTGAEVGEPLAGHTSPVWSVCFSPDGNLLASASHDRTVRLWNAHTGAQVGEPLKGHTGAVLCVCVSPDGKLLASASNDKTVRLWDAHTGSQVGEPLTGHRDTVRSVCFSPDGKLLASASDDKTVRLWDTRNRAQVDEPLTGHTNHVRSVCFSPDGKLLASMSDDNTARLWDVHTGAQLGDPLSREVGLLDRVCFSSDGTAVVLGDLNNGSTAWNISTREIAPVSPNPQDYDPISVTMAQPWVLIGSQSLLWISPVLWKKRHTCFGRLSCGTLVLVFDQELFIFDVSRLFPSLDDPVDDAPIPYD